MGQQHSRGRLPKLSELILLMGVLLPKQLLHALLEFAPGEQHAAAAGEALDADVSSQAHYFPLVAPTGVSLAQSHYVA